MIKKIELKIFLIIFVLLTIMTSVVIAYNAYNSYNSTIRGITTYIERLYDEKRNPDREDIEGLYTLKVSSSKIIDDKEFPDEIRDYTQKIIDNGSTSGIIGDYIYSYKNRPGVDKRRWNSDFI